MSMSDVLIALSDTFLVCSHARILTMHVDSYLLSQLGHPASLVGQVHFESAEHPLH